MGGKSKKNWREWDPGLPNSRWSVSKWSNGWRDPFPDTAKLGTSPPSDDGCESQPVAPWHSTSAKRSYFFLWPVVLAAVARAHRLAPVALARIVPPPVLAHGSQQSMTCPVKMQSSVGMTGWASEGAGLLPASSCVAGARWTLGSQPAAPATCDEQALRSRGGNKWCGGRLSLMLVSQPGLDSPHRHHFSTSPVAAAASISSLFPFPSALYPSHSHSLSCSCPFGSVPPSFSFSLHETSKINKKIKKHI